MRTHWVDVNLEWVDYLEARVEALVAENLRLNEEIKKLKHPEEKKEYEPRYTLPSMLVC